MSGRNKALALALLCGLAVAAVDAFVPAFANPVRRLQYDLLFRHARAEVPVDERISVFLIDDATLVGMGAYPLPRKRHAELLKGLAAAGVKTVAWDFIFDIPGPDDAAMADAMGSMPTVLALGAALPDPRAPAESLEAREALRRFAVGSALETESWRVPEMRLTVQSADRFLKAAAAGGHVATTVDEDGICRRVPLIVRAGGRVLPALGLAAAMRFLGVPAADIALEGRELVIGESTLGENAVRVPIGRDGNIPVNLVDDWFERLDRRSYLSQLESLREAPDLMADGLKGKLVIIGYAASAGGDFVAVPGGGYVPGVLVSVALANTILSGRFLFEVPALPIAALTLFLPLLLVMLHTRRRPKIAAAATGAVLLALALLSIALFAWKGVFFPAAAPIAACVLSAALLATRQHAKDYTRAARISTVLARFVSPTLLEELDSRGTEQKMPPPRRMELTVIFVDIAGFTPFTEESDPEVVSQLLAEVYPMAMEELFRHQGTLDSFKGDGVLAYFGAPKPVADKELKALEAAIAIRDRFAILDAERVRRGGQPLGIRCGITTGFVSVGYFGGERKGTYGVIGRAVNLAARIQGAGESGQVLLDRLTAKRVEDKAQLREIEPLNLKGIAKPVEVWLAESKSKEQETDP